MTDKEIVFYQTPSGALELKADVDTDTIWASQEQIAQAFGVDDRTVSDHINNIYKNDELYKKSTNRKVRLVRTAKENLVVRLEGKYQLERQIDTITKI